MNQAPAKPHPRQEAARRLIDYLTKSNQRKVAQERLTEAKKEAAIAEEAEISARSVLRSGLLALAPGHRTVAVHVARGIVRATLDHSPVDANPTLEHIPLDGDLLRGPYDPANPVEGEDE